MNSMHFDAEWLIRVHCYFPVKKGALHLPFD